MTFRLLKSSALQPAAQAGMLVVPAGYDYGIADDDTRMTGIPHTSVRLPSMDAFFTIPTADLEKVELAPPDDEYVKTVCKIGQGAACCRYLTMGGGGWSCEKLTSMKGTIDRRVDAMVAKGDNCEGRGSR